MSIFTNSFFKEAPKLDFTQNNNQFKFINNSNYYNNLNPNESPAKKRGEVIKFTTMQTIFANAAIFFSLGAIAALADYSWNKYKNQLMGGFLSYLAPYNILAGGATAVYIVYVIGVKCLGDRPKEKDIDLNPLRKYAWKVISASENRINKIDSTFSSVLGIRSFKEVNTNKNYDINLTFLEAARAEIINTIFQIVIFGTLYKLVPGNCLLGSILSAAPTTNKFRLFMLSRTLNFSNNFLSNFFESRKSKNSLREIATEEQKKRYELKKRKVVCPFEQLKIDTSMFNNSEIAKEKAEFEFNVGGFSLGQKSPMKVSRKIIKARHKRKVNE